MNFRQYAGIEFESAARMRAVQDELLRRHVVYAARRSPYYRAWFANSGLRPEQVGLDDLSALPLTGKAELAEHNRDLQAVPERKVVDVVFSSGTSGVPTRVVYSERDLRRLAYNEHQSFAAAGVGADDQVLLTCTMDRCFVAGLAYFLGIRSLGAAAIRNGHGTLAGHGEIVGRLAPEVVVGVPSFLVKLGLYLRAQAKGRGGRLARALICIGEPVRDRRLQALPVAERLVELWGAAIHSTYASTEIVTTFCECTQGCGGHLHPELAVVEVVDRAGRPLAAGEVGEVVVTPLGVEAMPLLRFRTGDLSFLIDEPCGCGRNSVRLGPILGRCNQMLKINGTTLYPQAIARALDAVPGVVDHYIVVRSREALSDRATVHVAVEDAACDAAMIEEQLQARLRVKPEVVMETPEKVRARVFCREYRKPMRFFDLREKS